MLMFFFYFGKATMHHRYFLEKQKEIVNLFFSRTTNVGVFLFTLKVFLCVISTPWKNKKKLTDNLLPMPSWAAGSFSYTKCCKSC